MSSICVALFVAAALLGQALSDDDEVAKFSGQAFGKGYTVIVTYAAIRNTPDWDDDAENPPVSAKKAAKLATAMKDSLVRETEGSQWEPESLTLMKFEGKWLWLVAFMPAEEEPPSKPIQTDESEEEAPHLTLPVLMDGTVIKPQFEEIRK